MLRAMLKHELMKPFTMTLLDVIAGVTHSLQLQFAEFGFKISQFTAIVLSQPTRLQNDEPFEPIFTVFPPFSIFNLRLHAIGT